MSIKKLTINTIVCKPFAEIDKSFNWINSFKTLIVHRHKQRESEAENKCTYELQKMNNNSEQSEMEKSIL